MSMGLSPLNAIYQARFNRYLENRGHQGHLAPARVGVPRRRRDGRTRVHGGALAGRARGPRQPDLRRELQPAAAGRPGPRQRQDHPGARIDLPRRRLARAQGGLGPRVGRAARARHRRRAGPQDGHDARRRVPAVLDRIRRATSGSISSARPAAPGAGRAPVRRRPAAAPPRRPRLPEALRGLRDRGGPARPADGDPGADDQGLDAPGRVRGPERHPPDEEALRRGDAEVPRPPRAADPRRRTSPAGWRPTTTPARTRRRSGTCSRGGRRSAASIPHAMSSPKPIDAAEGRRLRPVRRRLEAGGLDDDGVRPAAPRSDAGQEDRPPHRPDHPGRGADVRHGVAVPRVQDLRGARAAVRARSTPSTSWRTARRRTGRSWRRASPRPARWPRSRRRAPRTRRTASR